MAASTSAAHWTRKNRALRTGPTGLGLAFLEDHHVARLVAVGRGLVHDRRGVEPGLRAGDAGVIDHHRQGQAIGQPPVDDDPAECRGSHRRDGRRGRAGRGRRRTATGSGWPSGSGSGLGRRDGHDARPRRGRDGGATAGDHEQPDDGQRDGAVTGGVADSAHGSLGKNDDCGRRQGRCSPTRTAQVITRMYQPSLGGLVSGPTS